MTIDTDTIVIGAGPVGLFQAFQLGLLGLNTHVIDALPEAGGQCVALYPDKPIYDVPGVPVCTGRELAQLLLTQARPFLPRDPATGQITNLHLNDQVASVQPVTDGSGFELTTRQGLRFQCRAVFVAAGAGAFVPRSLNVAALEGAGNVHYHLPAPEEPAPWAAQHLVIAGGGEEALSTISALLEGPAQARPARLTLLHRRDQFQVDSELEARVRAWFAQGAVQLALGLPNGADVQQDDGRRVSALQILGADGTTQALPLDHLLVRLGLSPKLGPLVDWGLRLDRKQVSVGPDSFQSSVPGIYAVGDINTYPGKKRLLLCGFHEATLAAHHAHAQLKPDQPQHLQYTTTSALLHQRLGLA